MRILRHLLPLVTPNVPRAAVTALLVALSSVHATAQSGPADVLEARIEAAASAFKEEKHISHMSDEQRKAITRRYGSEPLVAQR